jgi:CHAT domain-containing protein/tetratricopeptide (TPR) repeat protein
LFNKPIFIFIYCFIIVGCCIAQAVFSKIPGNNIFMQYKRADSLYLAAENIINSKHYSEKKEESLNKQALAAFEHLAITIKKTNADHDSLAFHVYFKMGVLYHYFENFEAAGKSYLQAMEQQKKSVTIQDSLLFKPWLYKGLIYYNQAAPDSAAFCFRNAEKIADSYTVLLNESERLYNNLGILYHETGNFIQAKNYFEKALAVLPVSNIYYQQLSVTYKNNLASSLIRLEQFEKAGEVYQSLLTSDQNKNEVFYNLATIKLNTGSYTDAIKLFRKTNYTEGKRVRVLAYIGLCYLNENKPNAARIYFKKAAQDNELNNNRKNIANGLALKFTGDLLKLQKKYDSAVINYQQAISNFYPGFATVNITDNPVSFSGIFSYINLFNTLTAKADAYENIYLQNNKQVFLQWALSAYQSAFALASYVEKTYTSDEARLFLNKIKYSVHNRPIQVSLQLYELSKNKEYLEQAFSFDQQNKASILALNVEETALRNIYGVNDSLLKKEAGLKTAITRLSLKAALVTDSAQLLEINSSIRDNEILLGKLYEKMNELPGYRLKKFITTIPALPQVQTMLDKQTALLSYHLSATELVIFCITATNFQYRKLPLTKSFFSNINLLNTSLRNFSAGEKYVRNDVAKQLYNVMFKPILKQLQQSNKLLIIPDDELNHIPFEVLQDEKNNYVLENFIVQYQYTTALLKQMPGKAFSGASILAVAPFSNKGNNLFSTLSYSKNEIENLHGKILTDSTATKQRFLGIAKNYAILHLATHTVINNENPEKSLIAFYPAANNTFNENNLFVQEIYNLKLDATSLVILSACETGTGKLAKGEGLMSVARAFTYAGCPNIIASLWKADDKSTAWIIQHFYHYLQNGEDAATALQKAKLAYLQSPEIDKRFKTPNYWAHLVLTGVPQKKESHFKWWLFAAGILFITITIYLCAKYLRNYRK